MSLLSITNSVQQVTAAVDRFNADLVGKGVTNPPSTLQWGKVSFETLDSELGVIIPNSDTWDTYPVNTRKGDVVLELVDNKFRVIDGTYFVTTILYVTGNADTVRSRLVVDGVATDIVGVGNDEKTSNISSNALQLVTQGVITVTSSQQISVEYYTLNGAGLRLAPTMYVYTNTDNIPNVPASITLLKIG